ncbi:hypothetical protein [Paraburkholderia sp. BL25I1N1]|nr:hypothetical protein [Paraburkholderia sp. BL25I1N1]
MHTFETEAAAQAAWNSPENDPVQTDTLLYIDVETMITLPLEMKRVV